MSYRKKINKIIEPRQTSIASRVYDAVMLIAIVLGICPLMFRTQTETFWYFDIFAGICFTVDYVLRWFTCDLRSKHRKWIAFIIYPFTLMAIIDLLSILPTMNVLTPVFKVARVPRLLKIIRVVKFLRYFEPFIILYTVIHKQIKLFIAVLSLALFYIFIMALIMFNAEEEINPETGQLLFNSFFDAFYFAACTLTTVGYGDLYPISETGRVISIISSIVGIAIIALPSGIISAGYMDEISLRREEAKKSKK